MKYPISRQASNDFDTYLWSTPAGIGKSVLGQWIVNYSTVDVDGQPTAFVYSGYQLPDQIGETKVVKVHTVAEAFRVDWSSAIA